MRSVLFQSLCVLVAAIVLVPILYAFTISFMEPPEILTLDVHLLPDGFYLGNYIKVFLETDIMRFMLNSLIVALSSSLMSIFTASTAAFAFAFFRFPGKKLLFYFVLGSMMIPVDTLIAQNYSLVTRLGLINTYLGMMITSFVSATSVFIMRQYFLSYSLSLKEAAHVDGCSNLRFFWSILLPSSLPVVSTVFITAFIAAWNAYLWPLIVTNDNMMRTVQVAITILNFPDGSPYGAIMAATVLIIIPTIAIFLVFQKKIISGIMVGSVKG